MKFVHAADLHLDSPLVGLSRYDGAPVERMRGATRRALENLVALCVDEEVDLLLLAGDLFDGSWRDYRTGLFFAAQMAKLRAASVRVFFVRGNHDAASIMSRALKLPDHLVELRSTRPETRVLDDLGVAIHGQSYPQKSVTEDLTRRYPDALSGYFNIGLLHTSLGGREGHENYAPVTLSALLSKGYDYWALGHVHEREIVCQSPWVVFPGNLQGRHVREAGAKGATLVTTSGQQVMSVEHRTLDVLRWCSAVVSVVDARSRDDVLERVHETFVRELRASGGLPIAIRVVLDGETSAPALLPGEDEERLRNEIRAVGIDVAAEDLWVEQVRFATRLSVDRTQLALRDDPLGRLLRTLTETVADDRALLELASELDDLASKLPLALREGPLALDLKSPQYLREAMQGVESVLLPSLQGEADEP